MPSRKRVSTATWPWALAGLALATCTPATGAQDPPPGPNPDAPPNYDPALVDQDAPAGDTGVEIHSLDIEPLDPVDAPDTPDTPDAPDASAFERPAYQLLRHGEDWSVLAGQDTSTTGDLWDPIKYIPLSDDGSVWVSFGGQLRLRAENWHSFAFNKANEDTFLLTRLLFHGNLRVGEHVRVFAQGKSALSTERDLPGGRRGLDADDADVQQLFVDLTVPLGEAKLTFRPGRQMLNFGKQRLISPLAWSNTMRTWDGFSTILQAKGWTITGFATQFVPVQKYDLNEPDAQNEFHGVYATGKLCTTDIGLDLYWLGIDRDSAAQPGGGFNGTTGKEDRNTFGGRVWGKIADTGLDYDVEAAYQNGSIGTADIEAWMFASEVGLTLGQGPSAMRLHGAFDYATGDDSAGGDVKTFNQLFPLGHAYLGYIDAVGRQNILAASGGIALKPVMGWTVKVTGHYFQLAEANDALYNAGGGPRGRTAANTGSKEIGQEVDLLVIYKIDRHATATFGYSRFFPGDFLEESGSQNGDDIDFVYFIMQYTF